MNAKKTLQATLIAALFAAGAAAQAAPFGEGDTSSSQAVQVHSNQSFAAAQAASLASVTPSQPWGYSVGDGPSFVPVQTAAPSHLDRETVRQAAIRAERSGQIESGDALTF